jgi:hypothetical protein
MSGGDHSIRIDQGIYSAEIRKQNRKTHMKKLPMRKTLMLASACLFLVAQSQAVHIPVAITVDGQLIESLEGTLEPGDKDGESIFTLAGPTIVGGREDGIQITSLSVVFNEDPFILYALGVVDFGAPSAFGFSFATPILATANPASVRSSYSASYTTPDGSFTFTPPAADPDGDGIDEAQTFEVSDDGGVVFQNAGVDIAAAFASIIAGGTSDTIPAEAAGPIPAPAGGPFNALRLNLNFALNGGGDGFSANGFGEIVASAVPEAGATLSLLGIASLGLGACSRFRRK